VTDAAGRMPHALVAIGITEQIRRLGPATLAAALREPAAQLSGGASPLP